MGFESTRDGFPEVSADRGSKHATCEQKIAPIRIIVVKSFILSRAIKQRIASRWLPLKLRSVRLLKISEYVTLSAERKCHP
jgi:hypothetical protein